MPSTSKADRILPARLLKKLEQLFKEHNKRAANGKDKHVGFVTQDTRRQVIRLGFAELWELGYQLEEPSNFRTVHAEALIKHWEKQVLEKEFAFQRERAFRTMTNKISTFRVFCIWIGKKNMIKETDSYLSDPDLVKLSYIAREDKSWEAHGIDVDDLISKVAEKDRHVAMQLKLQYHFGFRRKESIMFRPQVDVRDKFVIVREGTKGGRVRVVEIEDDFQRAVLKEAEAMCDQKTGRMNQRGLTIDQAINRYKNTVRAHGIKRGTEDGGLDIVGHALRAGYANRLYRKLTGAKTPVQGGKPEETDRETDKRARLQVSDALGHVRISVTTAYTGSHGHNNRKMSTKPKLNWSCWGSTITVDANLEEKQEEGDQSEKDKMQRRRQTEIGHSKREIYEWNTTRKMNEK